MTVSFTFYCIAVQSKISSVLKTWGLHFTWHLQRILLQIVITWLWFPSLSSTMLTFKLQFSCEAFSPFCHVNDVSECVKVPGLHQFQTVSVNCSKNRSKTCKTRWSIYRNGGLALDMLPQESSSFSGFHRPPHEHQAQQRWSCALGESTQTVGHSGSPCYLLISEDCWQPAEVWCMWRPIYFKNWEVKKLIIHLKSWSVLI